MNPWIQAARLRTLPLALSGILLGSTVSHICKLPEGTNVVKNANTLNGVAEPANPWLILAMALITATLLQVLSNYANDYGDFKKGTDTKANRTDRALASGSISEHAMKKAIRLLVALTLIAGIALIYFSGLFSQTGGFYLLLIGVLAIVSAITYTVGKNAYGYLGLGDFFVLIFFGLVPVLGMGLLNGLLTNTATLRYLDVFIIAGLGLGLLSVGVLNVNNYRDIPTDQQQQKITLAVRLGAKYTLLYHRLLLLLGGALVPASFLTFEKRYFEWPTYFGAQTVFLIGIFSPVFIQLSSHYFTMKNTEPGNREVLNPQLKKLSLTILAMVVTYVLLSFIVIDFLGTN